METRLRASKEQSYAVGRPYLRVSPVRCEHRALPASEIPPAPLVDDYFLADEHKRGIEQEKGKGRRGRGAKKQNQRQQNTSKV